jgi:hypothetical protein
MPHSVELREPDGSVSARQRLVVSVERLPKPNASAFQKTAAPPLSELEGYRIVDDVDLRNEILRSGLGELVQRPGPGNWKKNARPPFILRIHPNFDAPASAAPVRRQKVSQGRQLDSVGLSGAVVHDLRTKWEQYYVDTRPDRQREHERRAASADPAVISSRAKQLISEAAGNGRRMTTRDAMLQATDEVTSDFESVMRRRHGDIVVDIFGIPEA